MALTQSVFDVGDPITSRLKLGVTPDGTTGVNVTVRRPDGTALTGLIVSAWQGTGGDERTVQWFATDDGSAGGTTLAAAGDWLAVWKTTGTGASVSAKVYSVTPLAGTSTRPAWSPFLSDVADHVPFLTIDPTVPGSQLYLGTFTGYTSPTDEQAQRHIDRAVAIVGAGIGTLTGSLPGMARAVAALWAAGTLARAYARDDSTRAIADSLARQASADLKVFQQAAENASETTLSARPVLYAPAPVTWGDSMEPGYDPWFVRQRVWPE